MASSKCVQILVKRTNPQVQGIPDFTKGILKRLVLTLAGLRGCDHVARVLQVAQAREDVRDFLLKLESFLWESEYMGQGAKVIAEAPTPAVYNIISAAITLRNDADKAVAPVVTAEPAEAVEAKPVVKKARAKKAKGTLTTVDAMAAVVAGAQL